jgi:hypothetical protein
MDQTAVKRNLLAELNESINLPELKDELDALLKNETHTFEEVALLLIKEMSFSLETGEQEALYLQRAQLIDETINNLDTPIDYAHRLLRLKLNLFYRKKDYDSILQSLTHLEDSEDPLAASTYDCYMLLLLKSQILFENQQYQQAYNYAKGISLTHFEQDYFLELSLEEQNTIINACLLRQALASHFASVGDSFDLFLKLEQRPNSDFQLNLSNANAFLVYGYESAERNEFIKSAQIFGKLFTLLSQKENKTENDLNAFNQVSAMLSLINSVVSMQVSIETLEKISSLYMNPQELNAEKNQLFIQLLNRIKQDVQKKPSGYTPGFEAQSQEKVLNAAATKLERIDKDVELPANPEECIAQTNRLGKR